MAYLARLLTLRCTERAQERVVPCTVLYVIFSVKIQNATWRTGGQENEKLRSSEAEDVRHRGTSKHTRLSA